MRIAGWGAKVRADRARDPLAPLFLERSLNALGYRFFRAKDLDTAIARLFNCYGPRMAGDDGRVVAAFLRQALLLLHQPGRVISLIRNARSHNIVKEFANALVGYFGQRFKQWFAYKLFTGSAHQRQVKVVG